MKSSDRSAKKSKKPIRRKNPAMVFLLITTALLTIALIFSLLIIVKLNRNNMFSKSILIDSNYFLENYRNNASDKTDVSQGNNDNNNSIIELPEIFFYNRDADGNVTAIPYNEKIENGMVKLHDYIYKSDAPNDPENDQKYQTMLSDYYNILYSNGLSEETIKILSELIYSDTDLFENKKDSYNTLADFFGISVEHEKIIDVPYISQEGILPNGCESVSAVMLLQYFGFDANPLEFVDKHLDTSPVSIKFGCRYGPNPKYYYAGDPRSEKNGWGCCAPVIVRALNKYLPENHYALNLTGTSLAELCSIYIDNDIPVAVWVTVGMKEINRIIQWQSYDKSQTYLYPSNEHCMVLVGYDNENYIFADPYGSLGIVNYPIKDTAVAYGSLGKQAVAIIKK